MKIRSEDFLKICSCRAAGECNHNVFADDDALDALVSQFAAKMRHALARAKYLKGRDGWDDDNWDTSDIVRQLLAHVDKGQPIDVAVFAAFWWNKLFGNVDEDIAAG